MNTLGPTLLLATILAAAPSANDLLTAVSLTSAQRHSVGYRGVRIYTMRNARFNKTATLKVAMTSRPGRGKDFTVLERSGTEKLLDVIEKLLASEAESSRPGKTTDHEIGPANYRARVRGVETVGGRECFAVELTPKQKSKYLVNGTAWVDTATKGVVHLDGTTSASVSLWVGSPHVVEDFTQLYGIWLPAHTVSTSNSMLLGESQLDIRYLDYALLNDTAQVHPPL